MKIIKLYGDRGRLKNAERTYIQESPKHGLTDALLNVHNSLKELDRKLSSFNESDLMTSAEKKKNSSIFNKLY